MITLSDYLLFTALWAASIFITALIYNKRDDFGLWVFIHGFLCLCGS
ncbi:hypothetical protein ALHIDCOG_00292 [Klebsiella phage CPRSB]|nr:hypothetical protein ALHIDCOG_00292 [Klebsiella phage CPRSB]